jgi:CheY-like chemotaxis protein/anti-sigma regulatory factor (Ser/Thr protein kinase)
MTKGVIVEQDVDMDASVHADRVRLKQILYNLLSNAVKFTPKDGRITIDCRVSGECISISVTDTGIGIRPEEQALVFEEFRQVEGSVGSIQEGTGLGLAITRRLVEQQEGTISLESEFGKGSRFTFSLPRASSLSRKDLGEVHAAGNPSTPVQNTTRHKPLVLIVDDELPARELLASYLEPEYETIMAESGTEAFEKAMERRPDAITLDVLMAKGSGFETLVALRKTQATASIPVIILSVIDQKQLGFALGASDYLVKPIGKVALKEAIGRYVPPHNYEESTILLVDDDARALELLEETLRSAGYRTESVLSGAKALAVLSSRDVGAVLLDLLMPDMDGFQVLRHIRRNAALKELPVLVMTAKSLSASELEILGRDAQALFRKDGSWQQQLLAEVDRSIRGQNQFQAAGGAK